MKIFQSFNLINIDTYQECHIHKLLIFMIQLNIFSYNTIQLCVMYLPLVILFFFYLPFSPPHDPIH